MADAALFEFLHMEMVAELWAHHSDPGPGVSAGSRGKEARAGQKMSLSVLEGMGFRVGQALGERLPPETLGFREGVGLPRWCLAGTYVLQDNSFPLLIRMASGPQYLEEAPKFLAFTCGLLRGTLSTLGIKSLVTASVASLPTCKFQVVIQKT
uniref:Trafficking protein particle complex subunit 6A n=1 Tax=Panthera tigris altaica TaxID=74533 RepID=A0A8C9JJF1_PANTA